MIIINHYFDIGTETQVSYWHDTSIKTLPSPTGQLEINIILVSLPFPVYHCMKITIMDWRLNPCKESTHKSLLCMPNTKKMSSHTSLEYLQ